MQYEIVKQCLLKATAILRFFLFQFHQGEQIENISKHGEPGADNGQVVRGKVIFLDSLVLSPLFSSQEHHLLLNRLISSYANGVWLD